MPVSDPAPTVPGPSSHTLDAAVFRKRLRWLIFHTWNIPPVFGLGFILLIGVLTPEQMLGILVTPLEPAYILIWLVFAVWFLPRTLRPVSDWLENKPGSTPDAAARAVQRFPLVYWSTFLVYLALAPASVIWAAELYTGFVATPYDWFRIELVALIVSIIVGLPIFFLIFDLFGRALGGLVLTRPIVTIRTKVFLIGALVPLLIDTMLVQYYWTRTGFFTAETFGVWLLLELIAIGGSLIFAHSFGQSLNPLQNLIGAPQPLPVANVAALRPQSTDELGLLTSDYRQLLTELQRHRDQLEERVRERTAQLESVNRELEAFSYSVSHDLRAPLRAIDGFAQALLEDYGPKLDAGGHQYLERVRAGAQRMGTLIDDLLKLSRMGRIDLSEEVVDFSTMAGKVLDSLRESEPGRAVQVDVSPRIVARGDARLLQLVLENLLGNAWKYTARAENARIEFFADVDQGEVIYRIRDNGVGFDMQYADKLFGAFQRLHGSEFPGTGIGLATVQRIVHRHGGQIWAVSLPGEGAMFSFTLGGAQAGRATTDGSSG